MMQIDWMFLGVSLLALLTPAAWIYPRSAKDRLANMTSTRFRVERMFGAWQHWFDLVRSLGGSFLLLHLAFPVNGAGERFLEHPYDIGVIGGILVLAVLLQTVQRRGMFYFTAPVFFLWGMTIVIVDWVPAVFAIVFSVVLARLIDSVELKLALMAGLLGIAGYLVSGLTLMLVVGCVLVLLPVLVALVAMDHLVVFTPDLAAE